MRNAKTPGGTARKWAASWGILIFSAGMMAYGLMQGEAEAVLRKAVRICLECIGIG